MRSELRAFIANSARQPALATLRGLVFEPFVHRLLGSGGQFEYQVIDPLQPGVSIFHFAFDRTSTFPSLDRIGRIEQDVYYAPQADNLAAADSFAVLGEVLYIFQITVAAKHDVKRAGALDIVNTVEASIGRRGRRLDFVLAFVVPPDRFQQYKRQNFVTKENKKVKLEIVCQQWVINLPLAL